MHAEISPFPAIECYVHVVAVEDNLKSLSLIYLLMFEGRIAVYYKELVDNFVSSIEPGKEEKRQHPTTREDYEFLREIVPENTGPESGRFVRATSKFLYH